MFKLSCRVDGLSPASIRDYSYKIGRCIEFLLGCGIKGASEVNTNHIRMFLAHLQESNKPGSVIGYYKSVHRFFAWLVEEEVIEKNPVEKVRPPKFLKKLSSLFSRAYPEAVKLCDNSIVGLRNKALILLFTDTGIRLREMSDLKVDDIDFDRKW
jgi:integrase/recombinase XerC